MGVYAERAYKAFTDFLDLSMQLSEMQGRNKAMHENGIFISLAQRRDMAELMIAAGSALRRYCDAREMDDQETTKP
jgi:hypothetical protein